MEHQLLPIWCRMCFSLLGNYLPTSLPICMVQWLWGVPVYMHGAAMERELPIHMVLGELVPGEVRGACGPCDVQPLSLLLISPVFCSLHWPSLSFNNWFLSLRHLHYLDLTERQFLCDTAVEVMELTPNWFNMANERFAPCGVSD